MIKFVKKDDGLVTIEWVGIAAVMILAAVAIAAFVMTGTGDVAEGVDTNLQGLATAASSPDASIPGLDLPAAGGTSP